MKQRHEPIAVVARFLADGTIEPMVFRYLKKEYRIKTIKWWKFTNSVWGAKPSRLYCICTEDDRIAEIEWLMELGVWQLVKI